MKSPKPLIDLGLSGKVLPSASAVLTRRVPLGNSADYFEAMFHKLARLFIYAKIFRFSQLKTPRLDVWRSYGD